MWAFKASSTLDSMVGYLDEKYRDIGWSSAKLDDVWNYLPARLTGCLLSLGAALCGLDGKSAFRIMRRDHRNHKSPNCAWSEAAAAGALHVQAGPARTCISASLWRSPPSATICVRRSGRIFVPRCG